MRQTIALLFMWLGVASAAPKDDIRRLLEEQVTAWNQGDVRGFMAGYENSPSTTFVGTAITRGYAGVLDRYLKRYPTKVKMGTLDFSAIEIQTLGSEYASVIGHWHLARAKEAGGDAGGIFTLLLRKTEQGWKIILDHTS